MSTTKKDLCKRIAYKNNKAILDLKENMELTFNEILSVLAEGGRIEIRGFGVFNIKKRKARIGRNPRTGEIVSVSENIVPYFKFSKEAYKIFKEKLNYKPF